MIHSYPQYLAFVRHGEYYQRADTPSACQAGALTPQGEQQAQAAALAIAEFAHAQQLTLENTVFTSQLLRAWQTGDVLSQHLQQQVPQDFDCKALDDLHERCVGAFANLTRAEIEQAVKADPRNAPMPDNWKSNSHYCLPALGAESLLDAGYRVLQRLQALLAYPSTRLTTVVGHGAAFRHAAYWMGVLPFDDIQRYSMHHGRPLFFKYHPDEGWQKIGGDWKIRETQP
ncbi:hypothetical protein CYQ88_06175 [Hydrogenovibrio sp. SC-1]|uniref:histidine phosphatase family protein n=1 Tax=Hydrogenovibrio sp. SC-1 TaxID=2065820 RepID=UPI000C7D788F|nr:histidine phosphatase family protein [Hydrogenovibrio sp. SC-1]PLA74465.1 hypothetical protein CYQ88_06175 [Hydrogenovibrio sp. SC-1]